MLNTPDNSPRSRCKKPVSATSSSASGTSASTPLDCGSVGVGGPCSRPKLGSTSDVNSDSGSVTSVTSMASATSATSATSSSPCKEKNAGASAATAASSSSSSNKSKTMTLGHKTKLKQIWGKVNQIARGKPG